MFAAFHVADLGCIRYKGRDRAIQVRLIRAGEGEQCDKLPEDLAAGGAPRASQPDRALVPAEKPSLWTAFANWWRKVP